MTRLSDPVRLSRPVPREGAEPVREVRLAEPMAGQLRGLSQLAIVRMEADAMLTLLPRITRPPLDVRELEAMAPFDFFALSQEAVLFFGASGAGAAPEDQASPTT